MKIQNQIQSKLESQFSPTFLDLKNESHMHSVPPGSETHFKLILVSERFEGLSKVAQQRLVYECLAEDLKSSVHALALRTFSPSQWKAQGESVLAPSPACMSSKKGD